MTLPLQIAIDWQPRLAREDDIPALEALIPISVRTLQASHYSTAQMEAALGPVFGVDRQLIRDGTYFVVERDSQILGCGGWSKRRSLYGGDRNRTEPDPELEPKHDAARVRAFFVHPTFARRGIGRSIMAASERAILDAGFRRVDIVATLAGEPLYASFGYAVVERYDIAMIGGLSLPVVRMTKSMESADVRMARNETTTICAPTAIRRGILHHQVFVVSDALRSTCFYAPILHFLGYQRVASSSSHEDWRLLTDGAPHEITFLSVAPSLRNIQHVRGAIGQHHHFAWTAASPHEVDLFFEKVLVPLACAGHCAILDPPALCPEYSTEYYAVFFEDPDGLKFEFVYNPSAT